MRLVSSLLCCTLALAPSFGAVAQDCGGTPEQDAAQFKAIDTDSDGKVSATELKKVAPTLDDEDVSALTSGQGLDLERFELMDYERFTKPVITKE